MDSPRHLVDVDATDIVTTEFKIKGAVERLLGSLCGFEWPNDLTWLVQVERTMTDDQGQRCIEFIQMCTDGSITRQLETDNVPHDNYVAVYENLIWWWLPQNGRDEIRECLRHMRTLCPAAVLKVDTRLLS
jgi:hypothetical protein